MAVVAPFLPYDKLREIAADFHARHCPDGDIPVPIERIVEFRFHLDIVPVPGLMDGFDIDAYITGDLTEIRVDRFILEHRPARYRSSLAHELAHVLIHRDVYKEMKFSTVREWKAAMQGIPKDQYDWLEWQAYCLGGLILVPARPLKDLFEQKAAEARRVGVELEGCDDKMRKMAESNIGRYFEVSADMVARRLKYDKLWR